MFSPAAKFATVIHLATGHVLAAVSTVGPEPKLEDVTAGTHVRVRIPATDGFVNVPRSLLKVTRIAINADNADVLDRPQHYDILPGTPPPLGLRGPPLIDVFGPDDEYAEAKAILVWKVGDDPVFEEITLNDEGGLSTAMLPVGVTHALLAIAGGPLHLAGENDE